jgi:dTDP-4-amino-4,6-dideoxygalactose transaminase
MQISFVDLYAQYKSIQPEIDRAIAATIESSAFVRGPAVEQFEREWATTVGVKHCVSCANGTDAIFIALKALGVGPGDEVITTAHSWIATSETISLAGGKVVFCDTERDSLNIDPNLIEAKITPRTVGIIPVHFAGLPAPMEEIMEIARRRGLWVVEDCAQAHLALRRNRGVGTFGKMATFSFYPGKNLGAFGDAGCVVTNDDKLAEWAALFARHGGKGVHLIEGINSRLDGMQAAVLLAKLPHLTAWTEARVLLAQRYSAALADLPLKVPTAVDVNSRHVYHLYIIKVEDRNALQRHLAAKNVATVVSYPRALPYYPAYAHLAATPEDFPNAHFNQSRVLSLPLYPEMTSGQQDYVVDAIRSFFV